MTISQNILKLNCAKQVHCLFGNGGLCTYIGIAYCSRICFPESVFLKAKFWLCIKVTFYEEFTNILVPDVVLYAELRSVLLFVNSTLQFCHY